MANDWNSGYTEEVVVNGEKYQVSVSPAEGTAPRPATAKDLAGGVAARDLPVWEDG